MKIAIINQKGGVGKTTVSINLAYGLASTSKRTLLVDLDSQANASVIFCPEIPREGNIVDIFERRTTDIRSLIRPAQVKGKVIDNLDLIPSHIHLARSAERMIAQHYRERRLHQALEKVVNEYDFVLLDCPPNLGVITINAIYTADLILIPTTYGRYALDGIADLFASIHEIRDGQDRSCRMHILRNAFDSRTRTTNDYIERELDHVRDQVFTPVIRKTEAINQAQISGEPIFTFDPKSNGSEDFAALTEEVLRHG
jgi:chromosome partitioning protein